MTHNQREPTPEEQFGRLVRAARESRRASQESIAQHVRAYLGHDASFDQSALARIEAGKRVLRVNEAVILARLLDIDLRAIERPELGMDSRQLENELASLGDQLRSADEALLRSEQDLQRAQTQHSQNMAHRVAIATRLVHLNEIAERARRVRRDTVEAERAAMRKRTEAPDGDS